MSIENIICIATWLIIIICFVSFIPKNKLRQAHVAFLFNQVITWLLGLIVVQLRLIEYPIRLFSYATKANFTFEYFAYPAICSFFIVYYPENKSFFKKILYYSVITSLMTILEFILERHTKLIYYLHWEWYWSWISIFITFFLTRLYVRWFYRLRKI